MIDAEINNLRKLGVKFECNTLVGRLFTIEQMIKEMGFDAVFIGTGAGYPVMGIPGESLNGVLSANELLTRCNLMRARFPNFDTPMPLGKRVAVIGAGNTAMDAMRVSTAAGRRESLLHLSPHAGGMPGAAEEVHHAEQEGVEFHWLTNPVEILGDDKGDVRGMRCIRMELGEPDDSGRRRPVPVPGSEYEFETDQVVFAIGTNANPIIGQTSQLKLNKWGYIDDRRESRHLDGRRLCRRRHRHRRRHRDRGDGRRPQGRAQHQEIFKIRDSGLDDARRAGVGTLFGIALGEHNFVRFAPPKVAQLPTPRTN